MAMTLSEFSPLSNRSETGFALNTTGIRTNHAYVDWIKRFICFRGKRQPADLRSAAAESFLI